MVMVILGYLCSASSIQNDPPYRTNWTSFETETFSVTADLDSFWIGWLLFNMIHSSVKFYNIQVRTLRNWYCSKASMLYFVSRFSGLNLTICPLLPPLVDLAHAFPEKKIGYIYATALGFQEFCDWNLWGLSRSGKDSPFPHSYLGHVLTSHGMWWMSENKPQERAAGAVTHGGDTRHLCARRTHSMIIRASLYQLALKTMATENCNAHDLMRKMNLPFHNKARTSICTVLAINLKPLFNRYD